MKKPKYKYFIYKARKIFRMKLINIIVTNDGVFLTLRDLVEKPIHKTIYDGVYRWEFSINNTFGYITKQYFINNIDLNHKKFNDIFEYIENDFSKLKEGE